MGMFTDSINSQNLISHSENTWALNCKRKKIKNGISIYLHTHLHLSPCLIEKNLEINKWIKPEAELTTSEFCFHKSSTLHFRLPVLSISFFVCRNLSLPIGVMLYSFKNTVYSLRSFSRPKGFRLQWNCSYSFSIIWGEISEAWIMILLGINRMPAAGSLWKSNLLGLIKVRGAELERPHKLEAEILSQWPVRRHQSRP